MKRLGLALVVGLLLTAGVATRGDGSTFSVVTGSSELPSATVPNGSDLSLAPTWTVRPVQPVQLSYDQLLRLWQNAGHSYDIPWNEGLFRPLEIVCPEGLICNARKPAAVSRSVGEAVWEVEMTATDALSKLAACSDAYLREAQAAPAGGPDGFALAGWVRAR